MRKKKSIELYQYWQAIRGANAAPLRRELNPGAIRNLLPDLFILEDRQPDGACFRLAGTRICAVIGHELRATGFLDLWSQEQRDLIRAFCNQVTQDEIPLVLDVTANSRSGQLIAMEMALLPLRSNGDRSDRIVGVLSVDRPVNWHGSDLLTEFTCTASSLPSRAGVASGKAGRAHAPTSMAVAEGGFPHRP